MVDDLTEQGSSRGTAISAAAAADVVKIRFVNGPGGKDLVHLSKRGANLMKEADLAGLYISRGCKSGLCGACMADLKDPSFVGGDNAATNNAAGREGFQAIKACSTKVGLLPGQKEMVIDLWRMKDSGAGAKGESDPMARFGEVDGHRREKRRARIWAKCLFFPETKRSKKKTRKEGGAQPKALLLK
jgi:ferredoxin